MKIGIITPIGPGHEEAYELCKASIQAAWESNQGKFKELEIISMWDLEGQRGRSQSRNDGIDIAVSKNCDWIFFLDADDLLNQFAFKKAEQFLDRYDAIWGSICEMPYGRPDLRRLREGQLEFTEKYEDILNVDPYLTLQIGHFVRTVCANEVRFDVSMNTGEDFKYYLGICRRFKFIKTRSIFFFNQRGHCSTGPKSADGTHWRAAVEKEIAKSREEYLKKIHFPGEPG